MLIMLIHLNSLVLLSASVVKEKGYQLLPNVQDLGAITKWMSDPPPKGPIKPPLQDKYHRYCQDNSYYCGNLESLRVEDRVNTLGKPSF